MYQGYSVAGINESLAYTQGLIGGVAVFLTSLNLCHSVVVSVLYKGNNKNLVYLNRCLS